MQLNGKALPYTVTVGTLPVENNGIKTGEVVFTAYTVKGENRPVTFALNGGPGASSVFLNLGAIGPKRIEFGREGDSPSDPATLTDNPGTWLDFTDLVFIDPIGTGFSRSLSSPDETKKQFYKTENDIRYLSRVIYDWLVKNERMGSRKYLVGESYGGYRGPRITHYLQTQLGVALNGLVLVSPYLNPTQSENGDLSPIPWMMTLPSISAAHLEREGKLSAETMAPVIAYTRGEYATDLLKGRSDSEATERIVKQVTQMTGLEEEFVRRSGGRLETGAYLREVFRDRGKLGSEFGHQFWPTLATRFGPPIKQNRVALFRAGTSSRKEQPVGLESQSGTVREDPARIRRKRRNNPRCGPETGRAPADGARCHPECHPSAAQEDRA